MKALTTILLALLISGVMWAEDENFNKTLYQFCKGQTQFIEVVMEGRLKGKALYEWIDYLSENAEGKEGAEKFIYETNIKLAILIYSLPFPELTVSEQKKWMANRRDELQIKCLENEVFIKIFK